MTAPITYGSLFTGVGGADLGFDRAGMRCLWQCEIDKNCRRLLAKRWPEAKLYHDITTIDRRTLPVADVVVGGSPCQDLSVAGKRAGLAGERSGLFRTMVGICKSQRKRGGARVVVWENVDGAFSSNDGRDFAAVLRAFTGVEVVVPDEGWGRAGFAKTPFPAWRWNVAWRVLDAQWFGVAQRRRRVFLVASAGDGSCAEILFEPESLRGDNPPSREAREGVAGTLTRGSIGGGSPGGGDGREQFLVPETAGTLVTGGKGHSAGGVTLQDVLSDLVIPDVAACVNPGDGQRNNPTHETLIPTLAHTLRGEGHDATEDGTGRGTPLIPIAFTSKDHGADAETDLSPTLRAGTHDRSHANGGVPPAVAFCADVSPTLGKEASGPTKSPSGQMVDFCIVAPQTSPALNTEGGGNRAPDTKAYVVTAFNLRGREGGAMPEETDVASVRAAAGGSTNSYVAFAQNQREEVREVPIAGALQTIRRGDAKNETLVAFQTRGSNVGVERDIAGTIGSNCDRASGSAPMVAITPEVADPISANEAGTYAHAGNNAGRVHNIVAGVRRLTPRECERLMAFPDDWTAGFADSTRYKMNGNAIVSTVIGWIGRRIVRYLRR